MKTLKSTTRHPSTAHAGEARGFRWAGRMASAVRERWSRGRRPDAAAALAECPQLRRPKAVALDSAYDEYRMRRDAGEAIDPCEFASRFPSFPHSLNMLIRARGSVETDVEARDRYQTLKWPGPGDRLLDFDLLAELGRGTFARVFLAAELALGRRLVALKVAMWGGDEAEILGRLEHPNIVPVYSVREHEDNGLTAICMPYMGCATLADVLDRAFSGGAAPQSCKVVADAVAEINSNIPWLDRPSHHSSVRGSYVNEIVRLARQMADALAYAHACGIYHRDLKPTNVLISPQGEPLLLDFNLSTDERVPAWQVGGTLPYMAPEELCSLLNCNGGWGPRDFDPRSDIFSLGVMVYELLTGRMPFGPLDPEAATNETATLLRQAQSHGPAPIREANREVDKRLALLIEACLAFQPEDRPASAAELAAALGKELTISRRTRRWALWHPRLVSAAAAGVLAVAVGLASVAALRPPYSERQYQLGSSYLAQANYESARDCFSDAIRTNPRNVQALIGRARAEQQLGQFRMAFDDYDAAYRLKPSPELMACKGYCLSEFNQYDPAIAACHSALEAGYSTPALLNNLGFCYLRRNRLDDAESYLRRAVAEEDDLAAGHHNLVLVYLTRATQGKRVPPEALLHAHRAVELCPPSGDLYRDVASLYAMAARQDATLAPQAAQWAAQAVQYGVPPAIFTSSSAFSAIRGDSSLEKALTASGGVQLVKADYLMDPLPEWGSFPHKER